MPALQRGSTYPTANGRGIRWYEGGQRRKRSGFRTDSEAFAWWDAEIAPRLRAGLPTRDVTLADHADRVLDLHTGARATRQALRERLGATNVQPHRRRGREYKSALEVFGNRTLRELEGSSGEIAAWVASLPE